MSYSLSLKLFWRELKSGQLIIMFFALVLAVATVSSISLFTDRLERALITETQEFLGGDLKFESNDLLEDDTYEKIQKLNLKASEMVQFASMLSSKGSLQLASIKAVDRNYPLVGELELQSQSSKEISKNPFFCPDKSVVKLWEKYLLGVRKSGSSCGAIIEIRAS